MGIPLELFLDEVPDGCICVICQDVLQDPRVLPHCDHAFCAECCETWLKTNNRCPVCRSSAELGNLRQMSSEARDKLDHVTLSCDNYDSGCTAVMRIPQRSSHLAVCPFTKVNCPNKECTDTFLRHQQRAHAVTCKYRIVSCGQGCGLKMAHVDKKEHSCIRALREEMDNMRTQYLADAAAINKKLEELSFQIRLGREAKNKEIRACSANRQRTRGCSASHLLRTEQPSRNLLQVCDQEDDIPEHAQTIKLPRIAPLHTAMNITFAAAKGRGRLRRSKERRNGEVITGD
ncbi:RING finger protein 151 [Lingula anatina]|uniref:RING finger protein 151 n=1 Tax=Lingula anatina TaxID=7574 RepID=A0A1S3HFV5_LINAN|nr:RING finger protein 151 [Lingula anatina]|eukprot:XP_013383919.1 RING finger protein 151 [Lingula anatina]